MSADGDHRIILTASTDILACVRSNAFMTNDLVWKHQIVNGGIVHDAYGNAATAPVDQRDIAAVADPDRPRRDGSLQRRPGGRCASRSNPENNSGSSYWIAHASEAISAR
jgi:hypothetical protein